MRAFRLMIGLFAVVWVAGCSGIPTREEIADRIAERALESVKDAAGGSNDDLTDIQVYERNRRALEDVSNTAFAQMPTGGAARFSGAAQVTIDPTVAGQDRRRYVGRANLGVDFASQNMAGRIDRFTRRSNGNSVAGSVSIRNGAIGVNRPNDFSADFRGTLRDGNNTIVLDGRMLGDFKGTPIRGLSVRNSGSDATWNGDVTDHALGMFLDRQ